jgi:signal transduction histidine kinase
MGAIAREPCKLYLEDMRGKASSAWLFLGALFVLCGVLGVLQYRSIGEVNVALRERLRGSLQASLNRVALDVNSDVASAVRALVPLEASGGAAGVERAVLAKVNSPLRAVRRIAIAEPRDGALVLRMLDRDARAFATTDWPRDWSSMNDRLMSHLAAGRPPMMNVNTGALLFESPVMSPPGTFGRREISWVVVELNLPYLRGTVLPEVLQRDLGTAEYQVEVVDQGPSQAVIYQSDPAAGRISRTADASVGMLDAMLTRMPGPGPGIAMFVQPKDASRRDPRAPGPPPGFCRWILYARHRAGSLEAAVSNVRRRNLAVTGGVLGLLVATAGALIRFTRRAQRLAGLEMDFVAGVSHELRTPLTVIHTAAYNLRGRTAANPAQVERYGELIQQESARLKTLVEQVLSYAGASGGRVIREPEPLSVETVISETLAGGQTEIASARANLESAVEPGLPSVMGDPVALKHALGNLVSNAAKYGVNDTPWIGVFAARRGTSSAPEVEIRVVDHGPGIPPEEQEHIFDAFFRGRRAVQDQIHGTGLGLNLVKKIVEAHGGTIQVKSEPSKGAEFVVRLPAIPNGGLA